MSRAVVSLGAASAAILVGLVSAGDAFGGEYVVAQCHPANLSHEALVEGADRGDYGMRDQCSVSPERALEVISTSGAPSGHSGYWYWQAPAGTRIVGVDVEAKLRRDAGHKARLYMADAIGQPVDTIATGGDGATSFNAEHWTAPPGTSGAARFYAALLCNNNGAPCPQSAEAKTFVRHVELTLRDVSAPKVALGKDAVEPGWKQGPAALESSLSDLGSGLVSRFLVVNGTVIESSSQCPPTGPSGFVASMSPCGLTLSLTSELATDAAPFHDGVNQLSSCAFDLAGRGSPNRGCRSATIHVDNTAPSLSFSNEQMPDDPELVTAAAVDGTSGLSQDTARIEFRASDAGTWSRLPTTLDDGVLEARVDSEAFKPGPYEFRASIEDRAGNVASTQSRVDRTPMELVFPLKDPAELDAFLPGGQTKHLAGYREPGRVRGFLLEPDGSPIAGERVVVVETFNPGALIRRRTHRVRSKPDGSFQTTIPGGPSRSVSVRYSGSRRYRSDRAPSLDYNVRSRVSLRASSRVRAGDTAHFRGAVGRYFARMPAGGKLVELQYKKRARTWNTAKEAMGTATNGRISIGYRFRRYYVESVTFTFRLKVTRENGWPYRLPATSKPVQVTVVPRAR